MNKKYMINWGIWMGIVVGIYALIYALTPLVSYGVMWATFVAMPIFLTSGGKKEDIIKYMSCGVAGVIWGIIFLNSTNLALQAGLSGPIANLVVSAVVTIICVGVHGALLANTVVNTLPPIFGGIAATLASSGYTSNGEHLIPLAITLVLGVLVGYGCMLGQSLLTEDGRWKIGKK